MRIAGFPAIAAEPRGAPRGLAVFLHGAFGEHTAFQAMIDRFAAAGYRAIAFARRGRCGLPPEGAAGLTVADYLDDVRAVLGELGEKPVLIGHSLGGLLAQHMAAEERCRALVLLASAPPGVLTAQLRALPSLAPSMPRILAGLPFRPSDAAIRRVALRHVAPSELPRILGTLGRESGRVYRAMILGTARPRVDAVRCPVLAVGGDDDWVVSRALLAGTARAYRAELSLIPGGGHWLPEEPTASETILSWLGSSLPR